MERTERWTRLETPVGREGPPHSLREGAEPRRWLNDAGALLQGLLFASSEFERAGGRVHDSVVGVAHAMDDAWNVTRRHGRDVVRVMAGVVDRRPYVAIGLAAAAGLIVGIAVRRALDRPGESYDHAEGWDHFV